MPFFFCNLFTADSDYLPTEVRACGEDDPADTERGEMLPEGTHHLALLSREPKRTSRALLTPTKRRDGIRRQHHGPDRASRIILDRDHARLLQLQAGGDE